MDKNNSGLYFIQYQKPLTEEMRFFFIELVNVSKHTNVIVGVASGNLFETNSNQFNNSKSNRLVPGHANDTIGYESKTGLMYFNNKSKGNMMGHKCKKGKAII